MDKLKTYGELLWATGKEWMSDDCSTLSAAIAYYTTFAIAPLLVVMIAVAGVIMGQQDVQAQVLDEVNRLLGGEAADLVRNLIEQTTTGGAGIISTLIAVGFLLFGASTVFTQVQTALDKTWHIEHDPDSGVKANIVSRIVGILLLSAFGLLIIVMMIAGSVLASLDQFVESIGPGGALVMQLISVLVMLALGTGLFALVFKYLPHTEVEWEQVMVGSALTAFLFIIGQFFIGLYIGEVATTSAYGAAGALAAILLWLFYSAWIFLYGAEFIRVWGRYHGYRIQPDDESKRMKGAEVEDMPSGAAAQMS